MGGATDNPEYFVGRVGAGVPAPEVAPINGAAEAGHVDWCFVGLFATAAVDFSDRIPAHGIQLLIAVRRLDSQGGAGGHVVAADAVIGEDGTVIFRVRPAGG